MKITVLTDLPFRICFFLKWIKFKLQNKSMPKYGGHHAVTRSIVEGLRKIGTNFNYNPSVFKIHKVVYVPGGMRALRYAIFLKKIGLIKILIAGPNLVVLPTDYNGIIKSKFIDLYLVNSEWVKEMYLEICPELSGRIDVLPAGVDVDFWKPEKKVGIEKNILIYYKRPIKKMFDECKKVLEGAGYKVEVIVCGKYIVEDYKESLNRNSFLIHFVEQESQGISLAEAWSMDTPTLVWNPGYYHSVDNMNYFSSSAPYLTSEVGGFFKGVSDFADIISAGLNKSEYSSREWAINNLSDEVCADRLLKIISRLFK